MTTIVRTVWFPFLVLVAWSRPALAQGFPDHGHFFGGGMGFGAMMVLGPLLALIFVAAVVAIIVFLVRGPAGRHGPPGSLSGSARSPTDIVKERFARGEIDGDEFEERRRVLGD